MVRLRNCRARGPSAKRFVLVSNQVPVRLVDGPMNVFVIDCGAVDERFLGSTWVQDVFVGNSGAGTWSDVKSFGPACSFLNMSWIAVWETMVTGVGSG